MRWALLVLVMLSAAKAGRAEICVTKLPFSVITLEGDPVPDDYVEECDAELKGQLSKTGDREEQVKLYMQAPVKSMGPLIELLDQRKTLLALIEIASDTRPYHSTRELIPSDFERAISRQYKQQAPRLIACFCDEEAGEFLVKRIMSTRDDVDRFHTAASFEVLSPAAKGVGSFLGYVGSGMQNIDLESKKDERTVRRMIKAIGKHGSADELPVLEKLRLSRSASVREDAADAISEISKKGR